MNSPVRPIYKLYYDEFDLKHPFLLGILSIMNIYGDYYSFEGFNDGDKSYFDGDLFNNEISE